MFSQLFSPVKTLIRATTMYRAMLYYLAALLSLAAVLAALDILPYMAGDILFAAGWLLLVCSLSNRWLGKLFRVAPNQESAYITALILALIFGPLPLASPLEAVAILTFVGLAAMASKYLLVRKNSHIFNPAALAAVAAALLGTGASWWVGTIYLLPLVVLGGLAMLWRLRSWALVASFLAAYALFQFLSLVSAGLEPTAALESLGLMFAYSPILFFTFVMLVEPMTSPGQRRQRGFYGVLIALAFVALPQLLAIGYALELALLIGNAYAAVFASRGWLPLKLIRREDYTPNIAGFWFQPPNARPFGAGQYMQWHLPHAGSDSRGSRRFFTIASSPTENELLLVTKFAEKSSSYKSALGNMQPGDTITASRPSGDFILPDDSNQELVLIAGGIGITPYRSMIKLLLDRGEARPIRLIYAARETDELLFTKLFAEAEEKLGIRVDYAVDNPPADWSGLKGPLDEKLLKRLVRKHPQATFYVAGPEPLVEQLSKTLKSLGVPIARIKRDFFPGYGIND